MLRAEAREDAREMDEYIGSPPRDLRLTAFEGRHELPEVAKPAPAVPRVQGRAAGGEGRGQVVEKPPVVSPPRVSKPVDAPRAGDATKVSGDKIKPLDFKLKNHMADLTAEQVERIRSFLNPPTTESTAAKKTGVIRRRAGAKEEAPAAPSRSTIVVKTKLSRQLAGLFYGAATLTSLILSIYAVSQ